MTTTSEAPDPRYAGVEPVIISHDSNRVVVYDRPASKTALATFLGVNGSDFNPWLFSGLEKTVLQEVVVKLKQQGGQSCDVFDGTLVAENVFEFRYSCKASTKSVRYCVTEAECRTSAAQGFEVDRSFVGALAQTVALEYWRVEVFDKASRGKALLRFKKRQGWVQITEVDFEKTMRKFALKKGGGCEWNVLAELSDEERVYNYAC